MPNTKTILATTLRSWTQSLSPSNSSLLRRKMMAPTTSSSSLKSPRNAMDEIVRLQSQKGTQLNELFPKYLELRGWDYKLPPEPVSLLASNTSNTDNTLALLSHLYTFPLTISYCASLKRINNNVNSHEEEVPMQRENRICIVGARAESSLTPKCWDEINSEPNLHISFIGPQIAPHHSKNQTYLDAEDPNKSLTLNYMKYTLNKIDDYDLTDFTSFFLFNPGVGHHRFKGGWFLTLLKIKHVRALQEVPADVVITCYSDYDLNRDLPIIKSVFSDGICTIYENPFRSRRDDVDDETFNGVVNSNLYVIVV